MQIKLLFAEMDVLQVSVVGFFFLLWFIVQLVLMMRYNAYRFLDHSHPILYHISIHII
ncbi:hypothetical protein HanIR_Chr01g0031721 [Helianthus annuus]|nr:hypothetical protein HanIR_Chr01g0031721 [Helianthus annuus]